MARYKNVKSLTAEDVNVIRNRCRVSKHYCASRIDEKRSARGRKGQEVKAYIEQKEQQIDFIDRLLALFRGEMAEATDDFRFWCQQKFGFTF